MTPSDNMSAITEPNPFKVSEEWERHLASQPRPAFNLDPEHQRGLTPAEQLKRDRNSAINEKARQTIQDVESTGRSMTSTDKLFIKQRLVQQAKKREILYRKRANNP